MTVERSTFESNLANNGGALYLDGGRRHAGHRHAVPGQRSRADGGAIYIATATSSRARSWRATRPGATAAACGSPTARRWRASRSTTAAAEGDGGGIYADGDTTIDATIVQDNAASRGGGIAANAGDVELLTCELVDNLALDDGGGLAVLGGGSVSVGASSVLRNEATRGGGAWVEDGGLTSSGSDWGAGSDTNDPVDVGLSGGSTYDYGASATFSCTTSACK